MSRIAKVATKRVILGAAGVIAALLFFWVFFNSSEKENKPAASGSTYAAPGDTAEKFFRDKGLSLREAMYYKKLPANRVVCRLCPRMCVLSPGQRGACKVRVNLGGRLRTLVYGRAVAVHIDPIEKKPIFHLLPGSGSFSIATAGCNLGCVFCQNWEISQAFPENVRFQKLTPEQIVEKALKSGCRSIAYTYSEPTIFYEYMLDTAKLAREKGLKNIWVTSGYINPAPLRELCKYLDAANVDLKGFSDEFYVEYVSGRLAPVLETLKILKEEGVWFEITNLVIPGVNDDPALVRKMCEWIRDNLGTDYPLHFSRFFPKYKLLTKPATPVKTLENLKNIAEETGIKFVYLGNIPGRPSENTYCPGCGKLLIERRGYVVRQNNISDGKCEFCGEPIPGVWLEK